MSAANAGTQMPLPASASRMPRGNPAPAAIPVQPEPQPAQDEVLPTPMDLAASGTSLPDLHLDIHVYSAKPAERFVFVNMRKYTEGQALKEGPTLERITSEGAILNHHGLRYLLPRQ
jgi:general secretion pathway protein B